MVVVSVPVVVDVRIVPPGVSMFRTSPDRGLVVALLGPHASAEVNVTGVNRGSEDVGSPPSGASMIHSADCPLKLAPGGGASVIEKCCPVLSLAKLIDPLVVPLYCTEQ